MRYSTKYKLYGRSQLVTGLRSIISELDQAIKATDAPVPRAADIKVHLQAAIARLYDTAQAMDIYKVERKRIQAAIERKQKILTALVDTAKAIPITQDEKVLAQRAKKEAKEKSLPPAPMSMPAPKPKVSGLKKVAKTKIVHRKVKKTRKPAKRKIRSHSTKKA